MLLDLRTVYALMGLTFLVLGTLQLLALLTHRFDRWTLPWGVSHLLMGLGTGIAACRGHVPDFLAIHGANALMLMGYAALLIGIRDFAGYRTRWMLNLAIGLGASLIMTAMWYEPESYLIRIGILSAIFACFDLVILRHGMRIAIQERLFSAWILVGLFLITATIFGTRAVMVFAGTIGNPSIFVPGGGTYQWMAVVTGTLLTIRGISLLLMAAERSQNRLLAETRRDVLTGALNREGLRSRFEQLSAAHSNGTVAVLVVDIDHFKAVNDTHGHAIGDAVLRHFTDAGRQILGESAILARLGGDEFAILLPDLYLSEAIEIGEKLGIAFAADAPPMTPFPTLSIGAAEGRWRSDSLEMLLHRADEGLYAAKRGGRDRVAAA